MKYVRLKPDSGKAFAGVPLFNPLCVYPVLNESEEDILIEMHPALAEGQSAKLVVPLSLIERMTDKLDELILVGETYGWSEQMRAWQFTQPSIWNSLADRSLAARVVVKRVDTSGRATAVMADLPGITGAQAGWVFPTHWLVPVPETKSYNQKGTPVAKKESKPEDKLLPKKSDASIGAIVIVIKPGEHQGAMMQITVWDSYRGRFTCYNGVHEVKLAQEDLNVLTSEQISIYREGALVTQSAAWIARRSSRHGPVGHAADTEPMVLNIHRVRSHCCLEVLVTTLGGIPISAISCSYDDVVPLTDEQRSLLAKLKGGDGRDAAWVRRATPPALAKAIDVAPTSMFIPDLIAAALGVQIPKVETSEQIWAEMMKQAKNIKFDEKSPVLLSLVTPRPTAAPVTAEAPAQAPERAVIEDAVTLPPAAPDDEENDVHHTDIE